MSYEPTIWKKGDKVTSTKLNKIENGIQGNDEEITSIKENLTDKAPVITDTASGSIASFTDGADDLPLKSLVVNIDPVQDLNGYSYPWPAGGGKNKFNGTFSQGYWAYADGGWVYSNGWIATEKIPCKPSTYYTVSADEKITRWQGFVWYDSTGAYLGTSNEQSNVNVGLTKQSPSDAAFMVFNIAGYPGSTSTISISDVTHLQIEEGQQASDYTPYSNICPISGWTGMQLNANGTVIPISWQTEAGTVYGGTLDVTTGKLTVDRAMVDLGAKNWYPSTAAGYTRFRTSITDIERISSPNVCASLLCSNYPTKTANQTYQGTTGVSLQQNSADIYIYDPQMESMTTAEFKSAMSGVQLCYEPATPQTYQLTPTEVATLLGDNTIWADTGDTEVEYRTDPDLYIQRKMPEVPVDDVQINGTSIVSDGVANVPVDTSLTIAGAAADSKATGDKLSELKEGLNDVNAELADVRVGANGVTYVSAGAAVRGQINGVQEKLSDLTHGVADINHIPFTFTTSNGYIASDGSVTSAGSSYKVSELVDISDYTVLEITSAANYSHLIYAFYDANESFISGERSPAGESSTVITDKVVRTPVNAKYIRVSNVYNAVAYAKVVGINISVKGIKALNESIDEITSSETYMTDSVESVTYESGYVNKSGNSGSGNYVHTNKIPVNEGDRLYLVYRVSGNLGGFRFVTAYNASGIAVFESGAENTGTGGYTVPSGITKVILSISGTDTTDAPYAIHIVRNVTETVISSANENDLLFGKKWCVCGDSFSYGGQSVMPVFDSGKYKGCRKVYPYFIGNRTHINIVDFTGNGRTLAYPSDGTFANSLTNPSADYYYQNIPADVDYITIYLGINDSHHASGTSGSDGEDVTGVIPIGTIDDDTAATFGGAWNVVLSWLITNRPKAHIGIIVSNGVDNVAYRNMTIAIAKKYGVAYIDLNGDERTPAMIRSVNPDIAAAVKTMLINKWAVDPSTNTHPNTDAHEYESYFIENFLRSI